MEGESGIERERKRERENGKEKGGVRLGVFLSMRYPPIVYF